TVRPFEAKSIASEPPPATQANDPSPTASPTFSPTGGVLRQGNEVAVPDGHDLLAVDPDTGKRRTLLGSSDAQGTAVGGEVVRGQISDAAWSADGRVVAFDGPDRALWVMDADEDIFRVSRTPDGGWVWSPTRARLAMVLGSTLRLFDASTGHTIDLGKVI